MLSTLAFVEFAAGDHRAVDSALTRMHECMATIGARDFVPDRSEPFHVESLIALGELERAKHVARAPRGARAQLPAPLDRRDAPAHARARTRRRR